VAREVIEAQIEFIKSLDNETEEILLNAKKAEALIINE
jgi:hypothetical protein